MAPIFCESVFDWAFEFVFFEFFELERDWRLSVSRMSPSRIDAKLGMSVVCVLCIDKNDGLYQNWYQTCPELYSNFIWENHSLYPP